MNPWATACPDWEDRLERRLPLVPTFPLLSDPETRFAREASDALKIFKRLRVPDVPGTPLLADACGPWFLAIVEALFGSYDVEINRRMINEVFCLVPKKNAKTSYGAALMLTALLMNRRPQGEFQLIAPTKAIADYAFRQIRQTIALDPTLSKLFHIQAHIRTITYRSSIPGVLYVKAADTDAVTGGKQVGTLIDETHEFASKSNAADVFVEIKGAMTARPEGFVVQISTQAKTRPTGVFKQELDVARAVRDGVIVQPLLAVIYEMPEALRKTEAWRNPVWWPRLNPNFGASVDEVFLVDRLRTAEFKGIEELALFASAHFNVEIGVGLKTDHWPGARHWEKNGDPEIMLGVILDLSDLITVGIDGGGLDDILGLCVLGRDAITGIWRAWAHGWLHRPALELRKQDAPKFLELAELGEVDLVDTMSEAFDAVAGLCDEANRTGKLAGIGLDPVGVKLIVDRLARMGMAQLVPDGGPVQGISQGFKLQGTIKSVEDQLSDGLLLHGAQPLMAWSVGNARIKVTGNAIMVTKQASGTGKIDPLMALFDAAALMLDAPEADGPSIYNNTAKRPEGFLVV